MAPRRRETFEPEPDPAIDQTQALEMDDDTLFGVALALDDLAYIPVEPVNDAEPAGALSSLVRAEPRRSDRERGDQRTAARPSAGTALRSRSLRGVAVMASAAMVTLAVLAVVSRNERGRAGASGARLDPAGAPTSSDARPSPAVDDAGPCGQGDGIGQLPPDFPQAPGTTAVGASPSGRGSVYHANGDLEAVVEFFENGARQVNYVFSVKERTPEQSTLSWSKQSYTGCHGELSLMADRLGGTLLVVEVLDRDGKPLPPWKFAGRSDGVASCGGNAGVTGPDIPTPEGTAYTGTTPDRPGSTWWNPDFLRTVSFYENGGHQLNFVFAVTNWADDEVTFSYHQQTNPACRGTMQVERIRDGSGMLTVSMG